MKRTADGYQLESGRHISANRGILGIDTGHREPHQSRLCEGYDGHIDVGRVAQGDHDPDDLILTADERHEIARHMIDEWSSWGAVLAVSHFPAGAGINGQ